jgi:hypothetical protein
MGGKLFPGGIAEGGEGDEIPGQVDLPPAVSREKVVVGQRGLLLDLGFSVRQPDHLGGDGFLFFQVLGKLLADGFLKISRLRIIDGKDGREAELADDFVDRGIRKVGSGAVGKQHKKCSFANFNYLPIVAPALPKVNQR